MRMSELLNEVRSFTIDERVTSTSFRKKTARVNPMTQKDIERMIKDRKYKGNTSALMKDIKKKFPDEYESDIVQDMMKKHAETNEQKLDEAKYEIYHKDFSSAMQHAYKMAKKNYGITVDPKEIDDKVASGPRKPSEGKTNSYRLEGDKGAIQVQVYNKGGSKPFELNMYKEEVELDEDIATMAMAVMGLNAAALLPVLFMAVREIIRGTPLESSIKNVVDKLKKNKNYKMSDSEKSDVKGFVSKVKKDKPSLLQKAMKKIKEEVELDESQEQIKQLEKMLKDLEKKKKKTRVNTNKRANTNRGAGTNKRAKTNKGTVSKQERQTTGNTNRTTTDNSTEHVGNIKKGIG